MFKCIQKHLLYIVQKNRKTFLIIRIDYYIEYFPLLRNNNKLIQHDKIWKKHM